VLSEHDLARALERIGRVAPVRFDEVTGSTQATALAMATDGAPEWTLVAAGHQTAGRGRLGRSWRDVPGRALLFSLILRPALPPRDGGLITLAAGTALVQACSLVADRAASCKWPNDVLVAGRKVAGVLAESVVAEERFEHVVLGVGVNLGERPAEEPGAGSLDASPAELLEAFLARFASEYRPGEPDFPGAVVAAYRDVCDTLGTRVRASTVDGELVEGVAEDLDEHGGLIVHTSAGPRLVRFGAIEHLG
jgi:BirA family biotin operon repressor/biotin-[acetyl-CoA-carboxylase] ligase